MDVTVLCACMEKFQAMFQNLNTLDGHAVGIYPFQYTTLATVVFTGIYWSYFLPEETIMLVLGPTNDVHSNMQIAWLNKEMRTQNLTL